MSYLLSLQQDLEDSYHSITSLLHNANYDEALVSMDRRLELIKCLLKLVEDDPAQLPDAKKLSAGLHEQEEDLIALASQHHQIIFRKLFNIGRGEKVKLAYRLNSKEF
ncbi:hypothetical protein BJP24_15315 [Aeromonas allosaccharophila]|uniref:hypothetical protein n=1 Tax=Aeromonas allosaccharophila TaxID=656 RepID=UPI0005B20E75|nr:hypothetical protein [Aeromonas allosaccharophila]OKP43759.1 hypothetical protein BJP24_15315 [Aeromonas allosaccharophila]